MLHLTGFYATTRIKSDKTLKGKTGKEDVGQG
jgi:hypothetical protein